VSALSNGGIGLYAQSAATGNVIYAYTAGSGNGLTAYTGTGNGVYAATTSLNAGVYGENFGAGSGVFGQTATAGNGVYGANHGTGIGTLGSSDGGDGVQGFSYGSGKSGVAGLHVGANSGNGVYGQSAAPGWAVYAAGNFGASGTKSFVEPHPTDASKEIRYASLEGREVGTYFRGSGRIVNGEAVIDVPADFAIVTSDEGLTVVATPSGELALIACVSKSLTRIVVRGSADVAFDYIVSGVRRAFTAFEPVQPNVSFVPRSANGARDLVAALPAESVRRLIANGTLDADGSINAANAHRLGWDKNPDWNAPTSSRAPPLRSGAQ
jgi:hypothetical protein